METLNQKMALICLPGNFTTFVLYDMYSQATSNAILGVCSICDYKDNLWIPSMILAKNGYGPIMYAIIAEYVAKQNGILIPSDSRSKASQNTWKKFDKNPYVNVVSIPNTKTTDGKNEINLSPTGFGIVGNGTIDLDVLYERSEHDKKNAGEKWYNSLVHTALVKMQMARQRV